MATVQEKYQKAKEVYGLSDEQFGQMFEKNTGQKFRMDPALMQQDYGQLLKAKPQAAEPDEPGLIDRITREGGLLESAGDAIVGAPRAIAGAVTEAASAAGGTAFQILKRGATKDETTRGAIPRWLKLRDANRRLKELDPEPWTEERSLELERLPPEQAEALAEKRLIEARGKSAQASSIMTEVERLTNTLVEEDDARFKTVEDIDKQIEDSLGRDFTENAISDGQQFIESFPQLALELATLGEEGDGPLSFMDEMVNRSKEGVDLGKHLVDGGLGATAAVATRFAGGVANVLKGDERGMDPFYEMGVTMPVTVLTTVFPAMKVGLGKLRTMAAQGDAAALAKLKKLEAAGALQFLNSADAAINVIDELPGRALGLKKEGPVTLGKTEAAPTKSGLFAADVSTRPMKFSDIGGAVAKGGGLGLLAGDPAIGAAIGGFLETSVGILRNSDQFRNASAIVAQYLSRINAGRSVSEEIAKRQLANDAPQIRDLLQGMGVQLRSLGERGKLFVEDAFSEGQQRAVKPIFEVSEAGIVKQRTQSVQDAVRAAKETFETRSDDLMKQPLDKFGEATLEANLKKRNKVMDDLESQRDLAVESARATAEAELLADAGVVRRTKSYTPEAQDIIEGVAANLKRVGVRDADRARYLSYVDDVAQGGMSLLKSETLVQQVINQIMEGVPRADRVVYRDAIIRQLRDIAALPRVGAGGELAVLPKLSVKIREKGKPSVFEIDLQGALDDAVKALGKKKQRLVEGEVMARFMQEQSIRAAGRARSMAMNAESARPLISDTLDARSARRLVEAGKITAKRYGEAVLRKALEEGEAVPQVIPRHFKLADLQNAIMEAARDPAFVGSLSKTAKPEFLVKRAKGIIDDLKNFREEGFKVSRPGEALWGATGKVGLRKAERKTIADIVRLLDDEAAMTDPVLKQQLDVLLSAADENNFGQGTQPLSGRLISKSLDQTLSHLDDIRFATTGMDRLYNFMKYNLTVGRAATSLNNFLSNVWYQGIRRGEPITALLTGSSRTRRFRSFQKDGSESLARIKDPLKRSLEENIFKQIQESGLARSNLVDAELVLLDQGLKKGPPVTLAGKAASKMLAPIKGVVGVHKLLRKIEEGAYRLGDEIFKVDEMYEVMSTLYDDLGKMKNNQFIDVKTGPNSLARISKRGNRFYQGKRLLGNIKDKRLARILGAVGRRKAVDLFVDYASKPGLVMKLQNMGPLALASPFLTWHFKAMGMGEKGFLQRAFNPDDYVAKTSNLGIQTRQSLRQLKGMMGRQMIASEGRREMTEDRRFFKRVASYLPGELRATIFADVADPRFTKAWSIGGQDFVSSEVGKLAVMGRVIQEVGDLIGRDPKTEAQLSAMIAAESGKRIGLPTAMRSLGVTKQPLTDLILLGIAGGRTRGNVADPKGTLIQSDDLFRRYVFPFALGGTRQTIAEILGHETGVLDQQNHLSGRFRTFNPADPAAHERLMEYYIRSMTGIGFKPVALLGDRGAMTRYLEQTERAVNTAFNSAEKRLREQLTKDPSADVDLKRLVQMKKKALLINAAIKTQVFEDFDTVMKGKAEKRGN